MRIDSHVDVCWKYRDEKSDQSPSSESASSCNENPDATKNLEQPAYVNKLSFCRERGGYDFDKWLWFHEMKYPNSDEK